MCPKGLPHYINPPLTETVLGVQFEPVGNLTNAHLGLFWKSLGDAWPSVSDAHPLDPVIETFSESAKWQELTLKVRFSGDAASRLQIRNADESRMIQVQNGRLHFNWLGSSGQEYPKYEAIREGFIDSLRKFIAFIMDEGLGTLSPTQWEVTYVNLIPSGSVWRSTDDWSFFRLLNTCKQFEQVRSESFTGEWHFVIPPERGRLHVHWQHGVKQRTNKPEDEVVRLQLLARGPLRTADRDGIVDGLDLGRETIVHFFAKSMSDEANRIWGLQNAPT